MNMSIDHYLVNQVETASSQKLVLMLYAGSIQFIKQALALDLKKDIEQANRYITRAYAIVSELQKNLDMSVGEVAVNLYALYDFISRQLVEANLTKEAVTLRVALRCLTELHEVWNQIVYRETTQNAVYSETIQSEFAYAGATAGGFEYSG